MSFGFGRKGSKQTTRPLFTGTDYSSREGGRISFDPSIRSTQAMGIESAATGQRALSQAVGQFGENMGALRQRLFSNLDPFVQARVSPMEEAFALQRGAAQRGLERRGLAGSSFGQQALTSQLAEQQRALGEQRALATQEGIGAAMSIDQLMLGAQQAEAQGNFEQANYLRAIAEDRARLEGAVMTAAGGFGRSFGFDVSGTSRSSPGGGN